jgi:6-phosphogluconolactonase (cycloisomerase 2 family)
MASNSDLIEDLTSCLNHLNLVTKHSLNGTQIRYKPFNNLDQIYYYKEKVFIIDWFKDKLINPCIHILNKDLKYLQKLDRQGEYIHWLTSIQINNSEYLGVLTEKSIRFIDPNQLDWVNNISIDFNIHQITRLHRKGPRPYGLVQYQDSIYFIETNSRSFIIYHIESQTFTVLRIQLPNLKFKKACFRDFKIKDSKFYFTDYKINSNIGNSAIHVFDLINNNKLNYIQSIGLDIIYNPYQLEFQNDILYVCERRENSGSIRGLDLTKNNNTNRLIKYDFSLTNCSFSCSFCKFDSFILVTQVFGNQFNYEGSSVLYKYDMPLI